MAFDQGRGNRNSPWASLCLTPKDRVMILSAQRRHTARSCRPPRPETRTHNISSYSNIVPSIDNGDNEYGERERENASNEERNQTQQAIAMDADRSAKRLRGEEEQQSGEPPPALFGPEHPTLEKMHPTLEKMLLSSGYLEPFDLIRPLHVCKAARRGAVPKLKKLRSLLYQRAHEDVPWLALSSNDHSCE
jgi:hypothetical protein